MSDRTWRERRDAHVRRVEPLVAGRLERRHRGERHPVEDFLFEYYSYRPAQLRRWHPGLGIVLAGATDDDAAALGRYHRRTEAGAAVDVGAVLVHRAAALGWIRELLARTTARPAGYGCFGLHEWAMVYSSPERRHQAWPLRLSPAETDRVVSDRGVRCTHYDAFRFFTPAARPLNALQLTRADQPYREQPGCLHATMDLYKWAYKLAPLTSAELVVDCFELATQVRELDMRASPYDLSALGYPPVPVETAAGRAEYAAIQRHFTERAEPLRTALIAVCDQASAVARPLPARPLPARPLPARPLPARPLPARSVPERPLPAP
jgi:hypothetical protein